MVIDASQLRTLLHYNAETGVFTWAKKLACKVTVGAVAGSVRPDGYRCIRLNKRRYYAHRLAWLHHYGEWPGSHIDHINGDPSDNRVCNLRDASAAINSQNYRAANRRNITGKLGVSISLSGKRFMARIKINGEVRYLGNFETPEAAHSAYLEAKRTLHEGCTI